MTRARRLALVGADGAVAGVLFARSRERENSAYAVAATALRGLLLESSRGLRPLRPSGASTRPGAGRGLAVTTGTSSGG